MSGPVLIRPGGSPLKRRLILAVSNGLARAALVIDRAAVWVLAALPNE